MTKKQNGLMLIGIGILLNIIGRVLITLFERGSNIVVAWFFALWMFIAVVVVLFGVFRLIAGLISRS